MSCLPIVTIGVAKISLYQTIFEVKSSRRVPVFKNTTESASFLPCSTWLPLPQARLKNAIRLSFLASIIADFLVSVNQK